MPQAQLALGACCAAWHQELVPAPRRGPESGLRQRSWVGVYWCCSPGCKTQAGSRTGHWWWWGILYRYANLCNHLSAPAPRMALVPPCGEVGLTRYPPLWLRCCSQAVGDSWLGHGRICHSCVSLSSPASTRDLKMPFQVYCLSPIPDLSYPFG